MRVIFYSLLVLLFFVTIFYGEKKLEKINIVKKDYFFKCYLINVRPRDFLLQDNKQEDI